MATAKKRKEKKEIMEEKEKKRHTKEEIAEAKKYYAEENKKRKSWDHRRKGEDLLRFYDYYHRITNEGQSIKAYAGDDPVSFHNTRDKINLIESRVERFLQLRKLGRL